MKNIKAIIVDDELAAREGVALLARADPDLDVIALCSNGIQALETIHEQRPQLLFLDIQMPRINGFEVLSSIAPGQRPEVIFITAHDEYTLQAFEIHAVDYLLKPFSDERFYKALQFAKERIRQEQLLQKQNQLERLLEDQQKRAETAREGSVLISKTPGSQLVVKSEGKVYILSHPDIIWVEAYDYYVKIHVKERFFLVRDSMKNMERNLPEDRFVRIHKSSIVNLDEIAAFVETTEEVQLKNGKSLKVSRNYREHFKKKLFKL